MLEWDYSQEWSDTDVGINWNQRQVNKSEQEKRNSIGYALELRLSCTNLSKCTWVLF